MIFFYQKSLVNKKLDFFNMKEFKYLTIYYGMEPHFL